MKFMPVRNDGLLPCIYNVIIKQLLVRVRKLLKLRLQTGKNFFAFFLLNVDKKTPLMRIKDLVYDDHNHPLHIMQEIICSDKFTYAVNH